MGSFTEDYNVTYGNANATCGSILPIILAALPFELIDKIEDSDLRAAIMLARQEEEYFVKGVALFMLVAQWNAGHSQNLYLMQELSRTYVKAFEDDKAWNTRYLKEQKFMESTSAGENLPDYATVLVMLKRRKSQMAAMNGRSSAGNLDRVAEEVTDLMRYLNEFEFDKDVFATLIGAEKTANDVSTSSRGGAGGYDMPDRVSPDASPA